MDVWSFRAFQQKTIRPIDAVKKRSAAYSQVAALLNPDTHIRTLVGALHKVQLGSIPMVQPDHRGSHTLQLLACQTHSSHWHCVHEWITKNPLLVPQLPQDSKEPRNPRASLVASNGNVEHIHHVLLAACPIPHRC